MSSSPAIPPKFSFEDGHIQLPNGARYRGTIRIGGKTVKLDELTPQQRVEITKLLNLTFQDQERRIIEGRTDLSKVKVTIDPSKTSTLFKESEKVVETQAKLSELARTTYLTTLDAFKNHQALGKRGQPLPLVRATKHVTHTDRNLLSRLTKAALPKNRENALEKAQKKKAPGEYALEVARQDYTVSDSDSTVFAQERIWRHEGIQRAKEIAEAEMKRLAPGHPDFDYYKHMAKQCNAYMTEYGKNWADCNFIRHYLWDHGVSDLAQNYIPTLPNAHMHAMWVNDRFTPQNKLLHSERPGYAEADVAGCSQLLRFTRVGAMTYEVNGWFSSQFLNDLLHAKLKDRKKLIEDKAEQIFKTVSKKFTQFKFFKRFNFTKDFKRNLTLIRNEISRLRKINDEISGTTVSMLGEGSSKLIKQMKRDKLGKQRYDLVKQINRLESAEIALGQLEKIMETGVGKVKRERERALDFKMLQYLELQAKEHPEAVRDGVFKVMHLGLLNSEGGKYHSSGWRHNEAVAMEDMMATFNHFNGKTLIFDPKYTHPFIDKKGAVHLPSADGKERTVKLHAVFVNTAVQNKRDNVAEQARVNRNALIHLKGSPLQQRLQNFVNNGPQKETHYNFASNFGYEAVKEGYAFSVGCSSAKDRGGTVSAKMCQKLLGEKVRQKPQDQRQEHVTKKRLNKYAEDILDPGNPLSEIIYINTGIYGPKVFTPYVFGWLHRKNVTIGLRMLFSKDHNPSEVEWKEKFREELADEAIQRTKKVQDERTPLLDQGAVPSDSGSQFTGGLG